MPGVSDEEIKCVVLRRLKDEYGDLNIAYVAMALAAKGEGMSIAAMARLTGLSRTVVRRALRRLSELNTPD